MINVASPTWCWTSSRSIHSSNLWTAPDEQTKSTDCSWLHPLITQLGFVERPHSSLSVHIFPVLCASVTVGTSAFQPYQSPVRIFSGQRSPVLGMAIDKEQTRPCLPPRVFKPFQPPNLSFFLTIIIAFSPNQFTSCTLVASPCPPLLCLLHLNDHRLKCSSAHASTSPASLLEDGLSLVRRVRLGETELPIVSSYRSLIYS